ncbi:hypothetical protein GCM10022236_48090 [Microlunatus ginsengisoli]|uniref:Adhesin domain-containing protein n=2 Tax=Microlunatus ginsengisoli TaxID=363863 RepID=A0ABP7ASY2_9ACTN
MSVILQDLAAGRIDAAEAARRIDALSVNNAEPQPEPHSDTQPATEPTNEELAAAAAQAPAADAWATQTDRPQSTSFGRDPFPGSGRDMPSDPIREEPTTTVPPRKPGSGGVTKISVRAVGRRVRIIGETTVATISADGPHVLRRNGSVLEVSSDGEMGSSLDGFSILRAPRNLDEFRALGLGKELLIKVNPNILVDVEVTAGSLNTERVPHLGKVRVTAGGAKLLDVREINDALIQAGSATIKGAISTGRSRVRAESGSLSLHLADDSNVTITGDAQLGKVSWTGGHQGNVDEVVMGNGSARLEIEVVMGHAQVRLGSAQPSEAGV